jgi:hypothetical protein
MSNRPAYRSAGSWSRSIEVNGVVLPLTDEDVNIFRGLLANHCRKENSRGGRALLHFFSTGRLPNEPAELRAWRESVRRKEPDPAEDAPGVDLWNEEKTG